MQTPSLDDEILSAEIVAVGSELLTPFRLDTNSLYLTAELNRLGIAVRRKTVAGDDLATLAALLRSACRRSRLVVVTGGLGPTMDDLTRPAAARALGVSLSRDPRQEAALRAWFAGRGANMPAANLRQAELLHQAEALPNSRGTAPGQWWERAGRILILLPGPPRELQAMFEQAVLPRLQLRRRAAPWRHEKLLLADIPESQADAIAAPLYAAAAEVETTILAARPGEIELHLRAAGAAAAPGGALDALRLRLAGAFGARLVVGESLESAVLAALDRRRQTLAGAESCTGGLFSSRLTAVPGASRCFLGGAVTYSNASKRQLLGVSAESLEREGAVSAVVAGEMARGARRLLRADWGVAITGIAGPDGGSEKKPVGLVYIACAGPEGAAAVVERRFHGDRERVRAYAAALALDRLRLALAESERGECRPELPAAAQVENR